MKYSKQRSLVLEIMKNTYSHPTAEEVYAEARKIYPGIGIATVYRNLNQLAEMGEINRISLGNGNDRYDGHLEEHYHMVCKCCGRLQDLRPSKEKLDDFKKIAEETFGLKGFNKAELNATIMEGYCDNCAKSKKAM